MRAACLVAVVLLAVSVAAQNTITQQWYTDDACTQDENVVTVNAGQCYLDSVDYSGMSWNCAAGSVVAFVYQYGDENCTGTPLAKKVFTPGQCTGPVYNNLYLITQGC